MLIVSLVLSSLILIIFDFDTQLAFTYTDWSDVFSRDATFDTWIKVLTMREYPYLNRYAVIRAIQYTTWIYAEIVVIFGIALNNGEKGCRRYAIYVSIFTLLPTLSYGSILLAKVFLVYHQLPIPKALFLLREKSFFYRMAMVPFYLVLNTGLLIIVLLETFLPYEVCDVRVERLFFFSMSAVLYFYLGLFHYMRDSVLVMIAENIREIPQANVLNLFSYNWLGFTCAGVISLFDESKDLKLWKYAIVTVLALSTKLSWHFLEFQAHNLHRDLSWTTRRRGYVHRYWLKTEY